MRKNTFTPQVRSLQRILKFLIPVRGKQYICFSVINHKIGRSCSMHQENYQIIFMFVNMHYIWIDFNEEMFFRLTQIIGGIQFDSKGNYFRGINLNDINSDDHWIYLP